MPANLIGNMLMNFTVNKDEVEEAMDGYKKIAERINYHKNELEKALNDLVDYNPTYNLTYSLAASDNKDCQESKSESILEALRKLRVNSESNLEALRKQRVKSESNLEALRKQRVKSEANLEALRKQRVDIEKEAEKTMILSYVALGLSCFAFGLTVATLIFKFL